ncbi:hypothetical protein DKAM_0729 [Desulfurococcus amylolyticus 1221n]|uniref:Uncharacterized protein n=1 Tax=Desulfurococcus amylolyticus (strain DSM 18924 / JCM 16383 / VKM B-2413 / 1221n) TaxID=490899 RepID=B8D4M4_DESA1|nr:hypothetical protein DKAM_0729 [Desulfurococcus amylolyticus 1221n]
MGLLNNLGSRIPWWKVEFRVLNRLGGPDGLRSKYCVIVDAEMV